MVARDVLLRNKGDIVGFAKYVVDPDTEKPVETIHGHDLKQFAKQGEHLVSVYSVQIFTEFEDQPYLYAYKGFDDPPVLLWDLNVLEKAFKHIIAWDNNKIAANPQPSLASIGDIPRKVSAEILNPIREAIIKSPIKVRSSQDVSRPRNESLSAKRQRINDEEQDLEHRLRDKNVLPSSAFDTSRLAAPFGTLESPIRRRNVISDEFLDEIEEQICNGRLEESIDQDEEERRAEEARARENSTSASRKRNRASQCDFEGNLLASKPSHRTIKGLSHAEKIINRLEKRSRIEAAASSQAQDTPRDSGSQINDAHGQNSCVTRGSAYHSDPTTSELVPDACVSESETEQPGDLELSTQRILRAITTQALHTQHTDRQPAASVTADAQSYPSRTMYGPPGAFLKKRQYRFKTRQRAAPKVVGRRQSSRMKLVEQAERENPFKHPRPCCNSGCFYVIDPEYKVTQYLRFLKMDRQDRKRALKSMYIRSTRAFWFGGTYVCTRFLAKGLRFSNQLQCAVKGTPKARASSSIEAIPRMNMKETKRNLIILYLRDLADRIGDSLPNKPHHSLPLISKKQVFERFQKFNREMEGREDPSLSYWCDVLKKCCSDIKTHRRHGFTVCDSCERIRVGFEMAENERVEAILRKEMEAHYQFVETERRDYERRRDMSRR